MQCDPQVDFTGKITAPGNKRGSFMKLKLLIALIVLVIPIFAAAQKKRYVGYQHKGVVSGATLPNGVKDLGGGLLSDENYGVSRFAKGKKIMLWLEKITSRNKEGIPSWTVKDVLSFKKLKKNREFLFSYSSNCLQNGKENLDLVVMADFRPKKRTYKVVKAWQANVQREKFEKLSVKGIVCKYETPKSFVE